MGDDAPDVWIQADIVTPMAIRVAATLRIADHITQGITTAAELALRTGMDLRVLVYMAARSAP
jgi:hypothetical protein